jgi:hypothetical protein
MCKWGTTEIVEVIIPAHLSSTGSDKPKRVDVDSCIASLVRSLNESGFTTLASCCGHGRRPGNIALIDGRELVIAKDFAEARSIDAIFPNGINE